MRPALFVAVLFSATAAAWGADWPMFGGNPAHSATSNEVVTPVPAAQWSAEIGGSVDSSPAVVSGRVYVGNSEGLVVCLNATDGAVAWRFRTDGAVVSSPAVVDGRVFVGSADRFLYALNADTGAVLWRCRTLKPVVGSPICVNGCVIFGGMDGVLRALAADSGKPLWKVEIGGAISTSPAATDAAIVCCDEAGDVQAVSPADGKTLWRAKVAGPVMASPSIGGGKVLVPVMVPTALTPIAIDYVVAFDLGTGNKAWGLRDPKNASVSATTTPAIAGDVCYVTTTEGYLSESKLRCISVSTGQLRWWGPLGGVGDSSPAMSGDTAFLGCHDGALWTWDTKTGRASARIPIGTRIFSSPALSGGRIYIGVQDGKLICLG